MANFDETKDYTFIKFCKAFDTFIIPKFQRPYDWKNKQLQEFLDSIIKTEEHLYFIGNIVSIKNTEESISIVDGQQRLTTIFLISISLDHILRNLNISDSGKEKVQTLQRKISDLLDYKDNETGEFHSRLSLQRLPCQKIFEDIKGKIEIEEKKLSTDTEKKYLKNFEIIKKKIEKEILGSELERINDIFLKVQNLQFVSILCASDNDINQIFEGFNSTGLGLSVADLVKNAVLQAAKGDEVLQEKVEEVWSYTESMFDSRNMARFPKFIRYQWISRHGYVSMAGLFEKIKSEKIKGEYIKNISGYVDELSKDAEIYMGHMYSDLESNLNLPAVILEEIKKFRYLQSEQIYSVLMSYYRAYVDKKIKQAQYLTMLRKLWIFAFRTRFVSISPSDYEILFANHCADIERSIDSSEISKYSDIFFSKLSGLVSYSEQFIKNLESDISAKGDSQLIKALLIELMSKDRSEVSTKSPENEHILPQKPSKWGYDKSEIQEFVHKLGNMTILFEGDNKTASDEVFEKKAKVYAKSIFKINKQISTKWKKYYGANDLHVIKAGIEKRGLELATDIEKLFKF